MSSNNKENLPLARNTTCFNVVLSLMAEKIFILLKREYVSSKTFYENIMTSFLTTVVNNIGFSIAV